MSIRVLRFMIGLIALVNVNNIYAVEYELEADNLLKLEISDSWPTRINLKDEKINRHLSKLVKVVQNYKCKRLN
ncbi:hypothetical protein OTSUT76_1956 [Orientia tsutsugamushi str. UT76]|uniref:Uncharacterized protein n=1 Tax=Orientia tsutsugamushi TaxID=784 RepID=A0A2U3QNT4_ORITS|nr:hypothetical protein [Orientia tsutsugamushi]KJV80667.1 hypothetical protein OTSUT76_1956 [Orientia tsutsugamushi str. UT76]SPR02645.1 Uncharacterised protein [Orientia tsutsugamushi]